MIHPRPRFDTRSRCTTYHRRFQFDVQGFPTPTWGTSARSAGVPRLRRSAPQIGAQARATRLGELLPTQEKHPRIELSSPSPHAFLIFERLVGMWVRPFRFSFSCVWTIKTPLSGSFRQRLGPNLPCEGVDPVLAWDGEKFPFRVANQGALAIVCRRNWLPTKGKTKGLGPVRRELNRVILTSDHPRRLRQSAHGLLEVPNVRLRCHVRRLPCPQGAHRPS